MKPYGGEDATCPADYADPQDELLEQVLDRENMRKAWKRKRGKGVRPPKSAFGFSASITAPLLTHQLLEYSEKNSMEHPF